jgi:hypothetical protein
MDVRDDHRRVHCTRCGALVRICAACDHGQRYCAGECARLARRATLRDAGRRYQQTLRGRRHHAHRQHRYRERCAQKVTHHGSTASAAAQTLPPAAQGTARVPTRLDPPRPAASAEAVRCDFCGRECSARVRIHHPWR